MRLTTTAKILIIIGLVLLIVLATFAYGNSQRTANQSKQSDSSQQTNTTKSTESGQKPDDNAPSSQDQSSSTPTPQQEPVVSPESNVPQTGANLWVLLPVIIMSLVSAEYLHTKHTLAAKQ